MQKTGFMIELKIKPLSINRAYAPAIKGWKIVKGKRQPNLSIVKSSDYKKYVKELPLLLPTELQLPQGKLILLIKFYFATAASDYDGPIKAMQDLICDYYGVNDNKIYLGMQEKLTGHKGRERIEFEFLQYHEGIFDQCRELIINTDG